MDTAADFDCIKIQYWSCGDAWHNWKNPAEVLKELTDQVNNHCVFVVLVFSSSCNCFFNSWDVKCQIWDMADFNTILHRHMLQHAFSAQSTFLQSVKNILHFIYLPKALPTQAFFTEVRASNDAQLAHLWCTRTNFHPLQVCPVRGVDPLNLLVRDVFTL